MNDLLVAGSAQTPYLSFDHDSGILVVFGNSYPVNAYDTYNKALVWVMDYCEEPHSTTCLMIELRNLNSASMQILYIMMEQLVELARNEKTELQIFWRVEQDDEELKSLIRSTSETLTFPINIAQLDSVA